MTCVLLLCSQDRQLSSSRLSLADASNIQEMVQEMCLSQGNKEHSAEGEESESEGEGRVCTLYMYIERFSFDHEKLVRYMFNFLFHLLMPGKIKTKTL